ncbi:sigma-70 family RNA polymerase sigma factor [Streptomyces longwoodensis]|uniref:RNA polymerase sigma factor n=1 Tax=Streptomyces longwoodensis TaxID=68231 RepID=UPI0033CD1741
MSNEAPRDSSAFEPFFRATYAKMLDRLKRRRRDLSHPDAEEVVQDAYRRTWARWEEIRDPEAFLWDQVKKASVDRWRKQQTILETPCDTAEKFAAVPAPVADQPEQWVDVNHVRELMGQLSEQDQKVLNMEACGTPADERAEALGVAPGTARVQLYRARKKLSGLVTQDEEKQQ